MTKVKNILRNFYYILLKTGFVCKQIFLQINHSLRKNPYYSPLLPVSFNDWKTASNKTYAGKCNPLSTISILCDSLLQNQYKLVSLCNLQETSCDQNLVSLRHDIDAHPPTAVKMGKIYSAHCIPASFYFLHSAKYYIKISGGKIYRNPCLEDWIAELASFGCEVGLHNDSLAVANRFKTNARDILSVELDFFRQLGFDVKGTVAHNSFSSHGAENFEVFTELQTFRPDFYPDYQIEKVEKIRAKYQLSTASMVELGLMYEGNYPLPPIFRNSEDLDGILFSPDKNQHIQSKDWMNHYLNLNPSFDRDYGADIWILGKNKWVISDRTINFYKHGCKINDVKNYLERHDKANKLVITLHPEYFMEAN